MKTYQVILPMVFGALSLTAFAADEGNNEFYGKIEQFPTAQNLNWVIGGKTFRADSRTKVDSKGGHKFGVGACVKLKGDLDKDGEFYVSEMEIKDESHCRK